MIQKIEKKLWNLVKKVVSRRAFNYPSIHEKMLSDKTRIRAYSKAIKEHIKEDDTVLDLGTGIGIFSFLASKQGAKVYAVDRSKIVHTARKIAEHNNLENITFIKKDFKKLRLPRKVDVIIQSLMGSSLLEEDFIEKLTLARDKFLKEDGEMLPSKFKLFIRPVKLKDDKRVPFLWEIEVEGIDFSRAKALEEFKTKRKRVTGKSIDFFLTEEEPVLTFDLEKEKPKLPGYLEASREVKKTGRLDGYVVYFEAEFDEKNKITTFPPGNKTHWSNILIRKEARNYREGDTVDIRVSVEDLKKI